MRSLPKRERSMFNEFGNGLEFGFGRVEQIDEMLKFHLYTIDQFECERVVDQTGVFQHSIHVDRWIQTAYDEEYQPKHC